MPALVLGPLLRHVDRHRAVIWVETDVPCAVSVLGATETTFSVAGHHYALVRVTGLRPDSVTDYTVELDGTQVWPIDDGTPPSSIRTLSDDPARPLELAFGSCRVAVPNEPPYTLPKEDDDRGRELDALRALALRLRDRGRERWPDLLLLIGDQVYADEISPQTREYAATRRDLDAEPGPIALDFEEYTRLYRESWGEPLIRWLLSTIPSAMIFDDHDVHDDWNTSAAWVEEIRRTDWWHEHIVDGLMSYWIYQHLGNLSPEEQDADELYARVRAADDATPILREFAACADREVEGTRWSYARDLGGTRLVVIDSRCGRVLQESERRMVDSDEWDWIVRSATGDFDHVLLATSVPWLLAPAMHHLEAWNEAVCGGAWGGLAARAGERLRRGVDLEHWAAFNASFEALCELQRRIGAGELGAPPASVVTLSGDVHHAYLAEVAFRASDGPLHSAVFQAVCSPMRNPLDSRERSVIKTLASRPAELVTRTLARSAGVSDPSVRWRMVEDGPWFDNQVATLHIAGRTIRCEIEKALQAPQDIAGGLDEPRLECVLSHRIA